MPLETTTDVSVGLRFTTSIGDDSNVPMEVVICTGKGIWLCKRRDVPNVTIPFQEYLILALYEQTLQRSSNRNANEAWWESLPLRTIVHYGPHFGGYVRGEIVRHKNKNQMHDFALVGKWHQPLVSYHLDGSKYYVPEAKRVIRGKISQPFFSNIYESPIFHHEKDEINPTKLLPVDLTLPPLTKEQRKTVKLWRTVKKLQNVLSFSLYTKGTPDQWNPETPDKVIAEVLTILERRK